MRYGSVCLEALGYDLPETKLSSAEIEARLSRVLMKADFPPGRLEQLTGIRERRVWPVGTKPSAIASRAAEMALERAKTPRAAVDLLIHAGVCRDALEPATASVVHHTLGLAPHCQVFDVSNACLGFLNAMAIAASMIELRQIKTALIVTGENAAPIYEDTIALLLAEPSADTLRKSLASLTLGSGAVAYVLTHSDHSQSPHRLLGGVAQVDSTGHALCQGHGDIFHQRMETDTAGLLAQGLTLTVATWELFKRELGWDNQTAQHVFNHQISRTHQTKSFTLMGLDPRRSYSNFEWLGNTGSVSTPLSLALRAEGEAIRPGDKIALLGIGSGINCMMLGVEW